jgi:hypothetical protein
MPRERHKPEEIVAKLRQVDVLVSQGRSVADAVSLPRPRGHPVKVGHAALAICS